jgi:hypothetical protein
MFEHVLVFEIFLPIEPLYFAYVQYMLTRAVSLPPAIIHPCARLPTVHSNHRLLVLVCLPVCSRND